MNPSDIVLREKDLSPIFANKFGKSETETIAWYIVLFLAATGDDWGRPFDKAEIQRTFHLRTEDIDRYWDPVHVTPGISIGMVLEENNGRFTVTTEFIETVSSKSQCTH